MKLLPFEYAVRNLGRSPLRLVLSVGGSLLVVMLVLTAAGFVQGMQSSMQISGHEDNTILLGAGSEESLERSEIPIRTAGIVGASVAGLRNRAGIDAVSSEIHIAMPLVLKDPLAMLAPTSFSSITSNKFSSKLNFSNNNFLSLSALPVNFTSVSNDKILLPGFDVTR